MRILSHFTLIENGNYLEVFAQKGAAGSIRIRLPKFTRDEATRGWKEHQTRKESLT